MLNSQNLHITILSPLGPVFEGNCAKCDIATEKGQLSILPRHMPVVGKLKTGDVKVFQDDLNYNTYPIQSSGFYKISNNNIHVWLTD